MQKPENYFLELEKSVQNEKKQLEKKYSSISTGRIFSFIIGVVCILIGVEDHIVPVLFLGICGLFIFIFLIAKHGECSRDMEVADSKQTVISRYIARYSDDWRKFEETGKEFLSREDTVATDIDLLGDNSLFQMIQVCHTEAGKIRLINSLKMNEKASCKEEFETEQRANAINELSEKTDFLIDFEAAGNRLSGRKRKPNVKEFEQYCWDENQIRIPTIMNVLRFLAPVALISLLILFFCNVIHYGYALLLFLCTLIISWLTKTISDSIILPFYGMGQVLDDYIDMMQVLQKEEFESQKLIDLKDSLCGENGAYIAFAKLKGISQAYNISFNPLLHQVLSGIFLWDFQLASITLKWKKQYGENVSNCFEKLGEIEELSSFAVIGIVRTVNKANISKEAGCKLVCKNLYHPLINVKNVVANSAKLKGGITIITGSNMSGKTTFLRTLAINLVLAYNGAPICGEELTASYMKIFTSMRIADDVANGISTFYAEILRIKAMADYKKEHLNVPMLCLIDEIFKGTNSADRIVGAKEVIVQLADELCMTIVSTHDFELCTLKDSKGTEAWNYHFEEYYENDELHFDYKIKNGRCTTTNAKAILKMAGFEMKEL